MSYTTTPINTAASSNNTADRALQLMEIQREGLDLFCKKNKDYGDAFATYGAIGVLVRIGDKIKRLMSISSNNISLVNDESMYDTLLDLHNYSAMALMLIKEGKSLRSQQENETREVCDSICCNRSGGWCGEGFLDC
jgi:hypothetical protein